VVIDIPAMREAAPHDFDRDRLHGCTSDVCDGRHECWRAKADPLMGPCIGLVLAGDWDVVAAHPFQQAVFFGRRKFVALSVRLTTFLHSDGDNK
jgi:hypothetical protein